MNKLHLDFETCSELDLKKVGVFKYAQHPSTQIISAAWAANEGPVHCNIGQYVHLTEYLRTHEFHAWNAMFEWVIWNEIGHKRYGWPELPLERIHCTMARAAYWGLPLSLDAAGSALNTPFPKDMEGHRLMLRMSRPRSMNPTVWWHETDPDKVKRLQAYNIRDIEDERWVGGQVGPLPRKERDLWLMDARMNTRGVYLDRDLVDKLRRITTDEQSKLNTKIERLTSGEITSCAQVSKLLEWVNRELNLPDLSRETVSRALSTGAVQGPVQKALELRQQYAKSSTAKLKAMTNAVCDDDRVRGLFQYYGASRTGRWAGRLIQLQNLPRPVVDNIDERINRIKGGGITCATLDVVSSCLRGCLAAPEGHSLVAVDLAQIEARVIAWLANQQDILDVFARGEDVYQYTAERMGSDDRMLGKVLVLACGFGMGPGRFQETAATYGLELTANEAKLAVKSWRSQNYMITAFWKNLELAVRNVLNAHSTRHPWVRVGLVKVGRWKRHVIIRLPSGRVLVYRNCRLIKDENVFGQHEIEYEGVNSYTKKWEWLRTYGGKLAENVTQAVARDVLAWCSLALEALGVDLIMTEHDELVAECLVVDQDQTLKIMETVMSRAPSWAPGLPVACEGWIGERYRK